MFAAATSPEFHTPHDPVLGLLLARDAQSLLGRVKGE